MSTPLSLRDQILRGMPARWLDAKRRRLLEDGRRGEAARVTAELRRRESEKRNDGRA